MRFKVKAIEEREDYEMMDDSESNDTQDYPTEIMVRLECDSPMCHICVPQSEVGENVKVGDNIEVTFGKPNIARA
jgi:hypothetical protein